MSTNMSMTYLVMVTGQGPDGKACTKMQRVTHAEMVDLQLQGKLVRQSVLDEPPGAGAQGAGPVHHQGIGGGG